MDNQEKIDRCTKAVRNAVNDRCRVYTRWMIHDTMHDIPDGCDDCCWNNQK